MSSIALINFTALDTDVILATNVSGHVTLPPPVPITSMASIASIGTDNQSIAKALSNLTNATGPIIPSLQNRVVVSLIYFIVSLAAIALHFIVAASILKTVADRKFHPFHILTMSMYFTDTLTFVVYAFYVCPCLILSYPIYGNVGAKIMGAFQTAGFIASITITFCISVNRALAISQNTWNKKAFRRNNCIFIGIFAWVLGGLAMLFNYYVDCYVVFDEKKFAFTTVCYSGAPPLITPSSIAIYIGAYGVGVFYVYAGYALYKRYVGVQLAQVQETARGHRTRLLGQAFFIWLSLLANVLASRIVNFFLTGMWSMVTATLIVFWSRSVPPLCMLIFAKDVRTNFMTMCGFKGGTQVTPLQDGATTTQNGQRPAK